MAEASPALFRTGSGEPLLLLHGFTGTWRHWLPVLGELAARFEVIAPTLSGHDGGTAYPAGLPLTLSSATDLLEQQLDGLGVTSAHVVGNSMGGALALELAKRGRARSVVALAPGGGWEPGCGESQRLARFFTRQLRLTRALRPQLARVMRRPGARHLALRDVMRHGELVAPADAVDMSLASLRCTIAPDVVAALAGERGVTLEELGRITCPVLLATPQFDRILPPELHAPRLRREIPAVQSVVLAGCGHVPMWDDARLVIQTIASFAGRTAHTAATV